MAYKFCAKGVHFKVFIKYGRLQLQAENNQTDPNGTNNLNVTRGIPIRFPIIHGQRRLILIGPSTKVRRGEARNDFETPRYKGYQNPSNVLNGKL